MRHAVVPIIVAVFAWASPGVLRAEQASNGQPGQRTAITFKAGVEAVSVTVAVRDGRGRVVRNLTQSDFGVVDSGVMREIRDFSAGDAPISLAMLLDISGSMAVGGNMDRARHAVAVVTGMLRGAGDEAAMFTFDSTLREVVAFTTDLDRIRSEGTIS